MKHARKTNIGLLAHSAVLVSDSIWPWMPCGHQLKLQDHGNGASVSHGVPLYRPTDADMKLL